MSDFLLHACVYVCGYYFINISIFKAIGTFFVINKLSLLYLLVHYNTGLAYMHKDMYTSSVVILH